MERQLYNGLEWVSLGSFPRLLAEGLRRSLEEQGLVGLIKTPFQWVIYSPVIELETGGYMGDVQLYVPETMLEEANSILEGLQGDPLLEDFLEEDLPEDLSGEGSKGDG